MWILKSETEIKDVRALQARGEGEGEAGADLAKLLLSLGGSCLHVAPQSGASGVCGAYCQWRQHQRSVTS